MLGFSGGPDSVMNFSKRITETATYGRDVPAPYRTSPGHTSCRDHLTKDLLAISPATGIGQARSAPISASHTPARMPETERVAELAAAPDLQRPVRQSSAKRSDGYACAAF
jgi:hypothetical protein